MSVNIAQIGGSAVAKNSGNKDNGTQRICIATDDVNLSAIQSDIATVRADVASLESLNTSLNTLVTSLNSKIDDLNTAVDSLNTILNDVWDNANNRLRVGAQLI